MKRIWGTSGRKSDSSSDGVRRTTMHECSCRKVPVPGSGRLRSGRFYFLSEISGEQWGELLLNWYMDRGQNRSPWTSHKAANENLRLSATAHNWTVLQATSASRPQGQDDRVGGGRGLRESTGVTAAAFPCQRGHWVTWKDARNLHCSYFLQ